MTRIFISHSHRDRQIAERLVDFLYAATPSLRSEDIRCTSVPGHQLPFGTSIGEQLKGDLNKTTGLIALITKDSLHSTWVLFELGSGWATEKLIVPILGPGLNYDNLPGPLKNYPGVRIDDENPSYRMTDVVNQLASALGIQCEANARRDAKLDSFIAEFRAWKSQFTQIDTSPQEQIEQLNNQLKKLEKSHNIQLQSEQGKLKEKESIINQLKERLKYLENSSKSNKIKEPELKSEKGIDYSKLYAFLAAGEWKKADQETSNVIYKGADRERLRLLDDNDMNNFPCEDLHTINQLWSDFSDGKFGFSIQKEVYENLGGTRNFNQTIWSDFCNTVGWKKNGKYVNYRDLKFDINTAPEAHLPTLVGWKEGGMGYLNKMRQMAYYNDWNLYLNDGVTLTFVSFSMVWFGSLVKRLVICNI